MPLSQLLDARIELPHREIPPALSYDCAWCGHHVSSDRGVFAKSFCTDPRESPEERARTGTTRVVYFDASIRLCPHCTRPTYFETAAHKPGLSVQVPAPLHGPAIESLPPTLAQLYEEVRQCMSVRAYSAAVMVARKILFHIAVQEGADPKNLNFANAVNYLDQNNVIPRNSRPWVDRVRRLGNEANHELPLMTQEDAEAAIVLTSSLLRILYELHHVASRRP